MSELTSDTGKMLALLVHDLRNPAATLTANVDFLSEVTISDPDGQDALDDLRTALLDIKAGLSRVSWIADGLLGRVDGRCRDGDAATAIKARHAYAVANGSDFEVRGGATIADLVDIFVENAIRHDQRKKPAITIADEGDAGVVICVDGHGEPMLEEFRSIAFSLPGQDQIKGRSGGRYARYCGLLAAASHVEGLGGSVLATEHEGRPRFEIRLPRC